MHVIDVRNVNEALPKMLQHLDKMGERKPSRYGNVIVAPTPVTTVYRNPTERVLFSPTRDPNPFFHLIEALWMLAGRRDVATLTHYVRRMKDFSDDGINFHGAYGYRWRCHFDYDQLARVVSLLNNHPQSRRAVIQMWSCEVDLRRHEQIKDIPCNLVVTPWINNERLDMTVFCRSNDAIWGAAGANVVQFSILQEYLASMLGVEVGTLYQVSNNFHAYDEIFEKLKVLRPLRGGRPLRDKHHHDEYMNRRVVPSKLIDNPDRFDEELHHFFQWHDERWEPEELDGREIDAQYKSVWYNSIFPRVVIPMVKAYIIFRRCKNDPKQFENIDQLLIPDQWGDDCYNDWLYAAQHWMHRRSIKQ